MQPIKPTKDEILQILADEMQRRNEILFAYVFGSFAEFSSFHDIDLAVYLVAEDTLDRDRRYDVHLSVELQKIIGHPVDVIVMNKAPDHLVHEISKGRVILDRDEDRRLDIIVAAWSRYFDFQSKRREYLQQIDK